MKPKKTYLEITVRVSEETNELLLREAAFLGMSRGELMRKCMDDLVLEKAKERELLTLIREKGRLAKVLT